MFALYEGWSCWEPSKLIDALQLSQSSPHPQVIDQILDPTTSFASLAFFIQRQRCRWWWRWYRIFTYKRYFGKNGVWSISTLRSLLKKRGYSLLLLTTNNIFTEEGVIDLGVSRALDSKTFLSQVPGGYSIWFLRQWVWVRTRMLPESCDITVGVAAYWALASALLPIRVLLVHSLCGSWNGWQTNNKGPGYFHSASQSKWVNCSSQPSIVHWLSSSIFPFVCRLSRYGDILPNLHFYFP